MARNAAGALRSWEGLLLGLLLATILFFTAIEPGYVTFQNQVNVFALGIEKAILVLSMTFVIISGEIDLSVAAVMGLAAVVLAVAWEAGVPVEVGILLALLAGVLCGLFNGFWVAIVGLPSLVVTLAGLIAYRGIAYILIEDGSIGAFPEWFDALGQKPVVGLIPLALIVYAVLLAVAIVVLHRTGFGRTTYVVGASRAVARFSGVRITRHTFTIFTMSGLMAAIAGVLYASHLGAVRGNTALGFELDVITIVLLGGVSIFGGTGSMVGVVLATLLILNLRNGLQLATMPGHTQTGVVGLLLIGSVLIPNLVSRAQEHRRRRAAELAATKRLRDAPEGS